MSSSSADSPARALKPVMFPAWRYGARPGSMVPEGNRSPVPEKPLLTMHPVKAPPPENQPPRNCDE